ncbi:phosphoribosylformylglycinamidine synthase subunit PurS [Bacillus taeanensis]|uniref:Phosphoribosylformylglycinamidine synthase subunit PurS n=1 Tax=Bacillus taeanensis TaxID=273032 RepID=A0A366Y0E6_9BACI|nr:phosphoribosylformylglycinamidine synthase subunit PurS [Bacillus taeanensis]RBW70845.1 phosphoribosylformylglycinamidine synthase subunit PurS [Bacillus taeanensis]
MYKVKVYVTLKESVLDPQGSAVKGSLHSLDYSEVEDIRIGKYMELSLQKGDYDVEARVKEICNKFLANPVIEDYTYEIEEVVSQ